MHRLAPAAPGKEDNDQDSNGEGGAGASPPAGASVSVGENGSQGVWHAGLPGRVIPGTPGLISWFDVRYLNAGTVEKMRGESPARRAISP